jgi:uncharacterized membrane protein YgcG
MQLNKGRKPPNPEAQEALQRISAIRGLFKDSKSVPNKSFESAGFMYLSRFNKDDEDVPKVREKAAKSIDTEEQSVTGDSQSVDSSHTMVQNSSTEKNRKYALSLATLASKPHKRLHIVNEGAISVLIELALQHDKVMQLRCSSAFASLSSEPSIRQRMIDDGAVAAIISLASNSNIREIKVDCCRAICNLCCVPNYEFKMVKDNVPLTIMNIAAACPETYNICLQTLVNMSAVFDKYSRIEDVTEAAIFFTNLFLNEEQEILLLAIFCNLSSLRNNQLRLVEDGCLRIVEKYYKSKSTELRRKACEMLKNFTADYRSRAKLIEINIISIVLEMSKDEDDMIRIQSAKCFLFLSKDRNFRKKIIRSDAFLLIMDTAKSSVALHNSISHSEVGSGEKKRLAAELGQILAKILRILCSDLELGEKLVYSDVGSALISLLHSDDIMIQQFVTESLCSLFQKEELLKKLINDNLYEHIVRLAYNTKISITKEWCSFALYQITESRICDFWTMEKTILPCILNLCQYTSSLLTKTFSAAALAIASLTNNIDCSNSIPLLVHMLNENGANYTMTTSTMSTSPLPSHRGGMNDHHHHNSIANAAAGGHQQPGQQHSGQGPPPSSSSTTAEHSSAINVEHVKKYCATALFNLANKESNCLKMFHENALLPVVKLTQFEETKVICAGIISRLSLHSLYYSQFAKLNVLKVLLELSLVDDRITQRRVVNALSNLSQNEELRQQLLLLNPISYIISLASERDEYLRRGCIAIVCNLSYLVGSEKSIVSAGIIPTLMITSLIATDQVISRIICVKAIVNLMHDRSLYTILVQEGAIWALSKLALMDNDELLTLCSKALCRLSCQPSYSRMMLSSSSTIKTVLHLMKKSTYSFKLIGTRILTNLLLETNETDESFRQLMVENMSTITTFTSSPLASAIGNSRSSSSSSTAPSTAAFNRIVPEGFNEEEFRAYQEEMNELSVVCLCLASQSETCRITIVQTGMLQKIDPSTIFSSNRTITYAYITMFSNIANNPMMRSKVLDNHFMERMERILTLQDNNLDLAVIKAIYCISCSSENIPVLIAQGIISFIKRRLLVPVVQQRGGGGGGGGDENDDMQGYEGSFISIREEDEETDKTTTNEKRQRIRGGRMQSSFDEQQGDNYESDNDSISPKHHTSSGGGYNSSGNQLKASSNDSTASQSMMAAIAVAKQFMNDTNSSSPQKVQYVSRIDSLSDIFLHHVIACLYNLTTNLDVLSALVSEGIVEVFNMLWYIAIKEPKMAKLVLLSVCHLACGKTNSSRMVREGCTNILCFIVNYRKNSLYSNFSFSNDIYLRCSAAFRNLLSVVSNQRTMIEEGCLPVLITLATQNTSSGGRSGHNNIALGNNINPLLGSVTTMKGTTDMNSGNIPNSGGVGGGGGGLGGGGGGSSITSQSSSYEIRHVRINCAAALKSLTFNSEVRSVLIQSDAIDIILNEIKKENDLINVSNGLLKELEAESWDNGGRWKQKDGRSKIIHPSSLFLEFLVGISKVKLDVKSKDVEFSKYYVTVLLEDDTGTGTDAAGGTPSVPHTRGSMVGTRASFISISTPSRDNDLNGSPISSPGKLLGGDGSPNSPHPNHPVRFSSSTSFQRNKLKKLATQASLVTPQAAGNLGDSIFLQGDHEMNMMLNDGLTIDKLIPFEDTDDTIGLTASRYGKKECAVTVNTVALIHYDGNENETNNSTGTIPVSTTSANNNRPDSPNGRNKEKDKSIVNGEEKGDNKQIQRKFSHSGSTASFDHEQAIHSSRQDKSVQQTTKSSSRFANGIPTIIIADACDNSATPPLLSPVSPAQHRNRSSLNAKGHDIESNVAKQRLLNKQKQQQQHLSLSKSVTQLRTPLSHGHGGIPTTVYGSKSQRQGSSGVVVKSKDDEDIKTIINLIKRAKDTKDSNAVDEVLERWMDISRY